MTMTKSMLQLAMLIGVITMVLGFTTNVQAQCAGDSCDGGIDRVWPHPSDPPGGGVWVGTTGDERDLTCTPDGNVYLLLSPSNRFFAEYYNLLLEAVVHNERVVIYITPGSNPCVINSMLMIRTPTVD
jgi:hypothetical protein